MVGRESYIIHEMINMFIILHNFLLYVLLMLLTIVVIYVYCLIGGLILQLSNHYCPAHLSFLKLFLIWSLWPLFLIYVGYIEVAGIFSRFSFTKFEEWLRNWRD